MKHNDHLKPLKPLKTNKKSIASFDIETYHKQCRNADNLSYLTNDFLMGSVVWEDKKRIFWDKKEMADFLLSRVFAKYNIYATNLDFDFNILFEGHQRINLFSPIERMGKFIIVVYNGLTPFDKRIFIDSMNIINCGVERLGKTIGIEKLDKPECLGKKDLSYEERKELEAYNLNDSFITLKAMDYFREFCDSIGAKMKPTLSSTGLDFWRRNYQDRNLYQEKRSTLELMQYIQGARTEMLKRGRFEGNNRLYMYDFNSMYPSVMKEGIDGGGSFPDPNSSKRIKHPCLSDIMDFEGYSRVIIRIPYDYFTPIGALINKKLYFGYGVVEGWYTHVELRNAVLHGSIIEKVIDSVIYTRVFYPFKDAIDFLYNKRMAYKQSGNMIMEALVKTLMNGGLYGKFGQKISHYTEVHHADDLFIDEGKPAIIKNYKTIHLEQYCIRGIYLFETKNSIKKNIPLFTFPILSNTVTALARIKLYNTFLKYKDYLAYMDTDSGFFTKEVFEDSLMLGELKAFSKPKQCLLVSPKNYLFEDEKGVTIKSKGIPQSSMNADIFYDLLDGKKCITNMFTKLKTSDIRSCPYGSIITMEKGISGIDSKRRWEKPFDRTMMQDSKPYDFKDIS